MNDYISVNMGIIKFGKAPNRFGTVLGSCIGLALFDNSKKIGGLAHIMLPSASAAPVDDKITSIPIEQRGKFADIAILEMINYLRCAGADLKRVEAKISGGAQMFGVKKKSTDITQIGKRNEESVKKILRDYNIRITADDTGGVSGRRMIFDLTEGKIFVTTTGIGADSAPKVL